MATTPNSAQLVQQLLAGKKTNMVVAAGLLMLWDGHTGGNVLTQIDFSNEQAFWGSLGGLVLLTLRASLSRWTSNIRRAIEEGETE